MCQRGCRYENRYGECVGACITSEDCPRDRERLADYDEEEGEDEE